MKYKKRDLVKIKSFQWWDEQEKDKDGDAVFKNSKEISVYFTKGMANDYCSRIGEIVKIDLTDALLTYCIKIDGESCWFHENWIEEKVEKINIPLKLIKNEI